MASVTASTIVHDISRQDLQELKTPASAFISSVKTLSSYNWIEAPKATPTIAVPGCPSLWSTPRIPQRLKKDSGLIYIAQNAARHPESPLEPLFRALFTTHSSFDIRPTDVVTDRNNIRKLLSFIDPSSSRSGLEEFTMNIELMKDTAILCRDEAKTVEYIGPHEFRGYGHEFEKAYTTAQISGSTGHHRIISYCFSDLNFIVRHETDGYVSADAGMSCSQTKIHSDDSLSTIFDALTLSPTSSSSGFRLIVKKEGQEVPLDSTLEIKTRVSHKPLDIQEIIPQLWASQTPKLVRAYHKNGTFQEPVVEDVTAAIKSWEERKQNDLRKLAALIREIISLVKKCGGKAVLKYNVMGDKLVICKVEGGEMLPKDLHAKWDDAHVRQREADTLNASMEEPAAPGQAMQESTSLVSDVPKQLQSSR